MTRATKKKAARASSRGRAGISHSERKHNPFKFSRQSFLRIYELSRRIEMRKALELKRADIVQLSTMCRYGNIAREMTNYDFVVDDRERAPDRRKDEERINRSHDELRDLFNNVCKETSLISQARRIGLR